MNTSGWRDAMLSMLVFEILVMPERIFVAASSIKPVRLTKFDPVIMDEVIVDSNFTAWDTGGSFSGMLMTCDYLVCYASALIRRSHDSGRSDSPNRLTEYRTALMNACCRLF
jgi:hypothetical protein